jgi:hypothetical protein
MKGRGLLPVPGQPRNRVAHISIGLTRNPGKRYRSRLVSVTRQVSVPTVPSAGTSGDPP